MKRHIGLALVLGLLMTSMLPSTVFAASESEQSISGRLNNYVVPEVIAIGVENMDNQAVADLDPQTNYRFRVTIRDNNTLSDIENVVLELYVDNIDLPDNGRNDYRFLFKASDNSWSELGPDTDNRHIVAGSCVYPSDLTQTADDYVFVVKFDVIAMPTSTDQWDTYAKATDDNDATGELTDGDNFDVNDYVSLTIDDENLTFNGSPGDENVKPTEQPTVATVDANVNFDIKCKLGSDWSGNNGGTIGAENTKAAQDNLHTNENVLHENAYTSDLWSNVLYGENVAKNIYWFLNIPSTATDTYYTTTFYVKAIKTDD